MRAIPGVAAQQFGCFTNWQAANDGWTADALERAVRRERLERVRAGVYRATEEAGDIWAARRSGHAAKAVAAVLSIPGTRVTGAAATILYDLSLLRIPERACVGCERWLTGSVPDVHLHRSVSIEQLRFGGVACDSVPRTVCEIAREHGVVAGVVALDHALHTGATGLDAVGTELTRMRGWPGSRRAVRALQLADARSESVLETRSRLAIDRSGLPAPDLQVTIGNSWGGFAARVDFYWDEFGVVGEVDGALKYDGAQPLALHREKKRQELLEELGLTVVRWSKAQTDFFDPTAERIRRAFTRAARLPFADRHWTVLPCLDLPIRAQQA